VLGLIPEPGWKKGIVDRNKVSDVLVPNLIPSCNSSGKPKRRKLKKTNLSDRLGYNKGILEITQIKLVENDTVRVKEEPNSGLSRSKVEVVNDQKPLTNSSLITRIEPIKVTMKCRESLDQRMSMTNKENYNRSEQQHDTMLLAQSSFKETLLKAFPNPNFKLKYAQRNEMQTNRIMIETRVCSSSGSSGRIPVLSKPNGTQISLGKLDAKEILILQPVTPYYRKKQRIKSKTSDGNQMNEYHPPPSISQTVSCSLPNRQPLGETPEQKEEIVKINEESRFIDFGVQTGRSYTTIMKNPLDRRSISPGETSQLTSPLNSRSEMPFRGNVHSNNQECRDSRDCRWCNCSQIGKEYENDRYSQNHPPFFRLRIQNETPEKCDLIGTRPFCRNSNDSPLESQSRRTSRGYATDATYTKEEFDSLAEFETIELLCNTGPRNLLGCLFTGIPGKEEDDILIESPTAQKIGNVMKTMLRSSDYAEDCLIKQTRTQDQTEHNDDPLFSTLFTRNIESVSSTSSFDLQPNLKNDEIIRKTARSLRTDEDAAKCKGPVSYLAKEEDNVPPKDPPASPATAFSSVEYQSNSCSSECCPPSTRSSSSFRTNQDATSQNEECPEADNKRYFKFPLDDKGSEVVVQITLPFHLSNQSFPPDCPYVACAVLNTAHKLIKEQCNQGINSNNLESGDDVGLSMECVVNIEELLLASRSSSNSHSCLSNSHVSKGKKGDQIITLTDGKQSWEQDEIQGDILTCNTHDLIKEDTAKTPATKIRKTKNRKGIRPGKFLECLLSCGCGCLPRWNAKVYPTRSSHFTSESNYCNLYDRMKVKNKSTSNN
jgi:hypothetical protein